MRKEESIQIHICNYLRYQYPDVIWCCDYAAGMKLNIGQAIKAKKLRSSRALPDFMIFTPNRLFNGLFLELKQEGTRLKKKNGDWTTPHIEEQAIILKRLQDNGYKAEFAFGIDDAITVINDYMKL